MPIYMKFGSIKGDVTESGHTDWIELNSLQWGVGRGVSSPTGSSADRESTAPSISEVVVTKANDLASAGLLSEALQGDGSNGKSVEIDMVRTDKGKLTVYQKITLTGRDHQRLLHQQRWRPAERESLSQFRQDRRHGHADEAGWHRRQSSHHHLRPRPGENRLTARQVAA